MENDCLRNKYSSVRFHRVPAIAQDTHRPFVIPVVNGLLQNISVRRVIHENAAERAGTRRAG